MPKIPSFEDFGKRMKEMQDHMKEAGSQGGNNGEYSSSSSSFYDSENDSGNHGAHKEMSSQKTECHNGVCKTVKCHNGKCDIVGDKHAENKMIAPSS